MSSRPHHAMRTGSSGSRWAAPGALTTWGALVVAAMIMPGVVALAATAGEPRLDVGRQWGQWRGPLASGAAPEADPPLVWSEERNVRWKVPLGGKGQSTPVIWGDRIFLTTAVPHGEAVAPPARQADGAHDNLPPVRQQRFMVLALDRADGSVLWERTVRDARPHEGAHVTGSWASASAVTDGEQVFAFFGSQGLFAFDMDGKPLWEADLGDMEIYHGHGEGSSPALHGNVLVVNWDHQGESFLLALDKRTGSRLWRVARDEITSWSTPLIVEHDGKAQVVVAATGRVRGYDLATGGLIWECGGLSRNVVATPVAGDGLVHVASSYDHQAMLAIRLQGARGDITGTGAVVWKRERDTPYVPSPLLYEGRLFFIKHLQGFLTGVDAATGKTVWGPQRLDGVRNIFASPVGAGGRIYVVDRNGTTAVIRNGDTFEVMALNRLDDSFAASPAVVGDELYLRGERNLYCLAEAPTNEDGQGGEGGHSHGGRLDLEAGDRRF